MYLENGEILHLANKKSYRVNGFNVYDNTYYYLLENIDNNKYTVVNTYLIDSELYLKEVKDEDILIKLNF